MIQDDDNWKTYNTKITKLEGLKNLYDLNESINLKSNISQIKWKYYITVLKVKLIFKVLLYLIPPREVLILIP